VAARWDPSGSSEFFPNLKAKEGTITAWPWPWSHWSWLKDASKDDWMKDTHSKVWRRKKIVLKCVEPWVISDVSEETLWGQPARNKEILTWGSSDSVCTYMHAHVYTYLLTEKFTYSRGRATFSKYHAWQEGRRKLLHQRQQRSICNAKRRRMCTLVWGMCQPNLPTETPVWSISGFTTPGQQRTNTPRWKHEGTPQDPAIESHSDTSTETPDYSGA